MDGQYSNHVYPRATDPVNDKFLEVRAVTPNTFDVFVGITTNVGWTPTDAVYDPVAGIMTMTIPNHNIMAGTSIKVKDNSLNFKCAMDGNTTHHTYPRSGDPVSGQTIAITSVSTNTFTINVGTSPLVAFNVTDATYNPSTGIMTVKVTGHSMRDKDWIRFDDESIKFTCDFGQTEKSYPRVGDPVRGKWIPITYVDANNFEVFVGKTPFDFKASYATLPSEITSDLFTP